LHCAKKEPHRAAGSDKDVGMKRRKTRNPLIWFQYGCWRVCTWMMFHRPYYPLRLRIWLSYRYPEERWSLTWAMIDQWRRVRPDYTPRHLPLPWYIGANAIGPFVGPWDRVQRIFRKGTGGRTHRCEFTDPQRGALYGHNEGPFMNAYFDKLIENISADDGE
jgi:hypothetical protein